MENLIFYITTPVIIIMIITLITLFNKGTPDEEISPELKDKLIEAYGEKWHIAKLICNYEGWIKYYEYPDSFNQDYKVTTIDGIVCYRPKLK